MGSVTTLAEWRIGLCEELNPILSKQENSYECWASNPICSDTTYQPMLPTRHQHSHHFFIIKQCKSVLLLLKSTESQQPTFSTLNWLLMMSRSPSINSVYYERVLRVAAILRCSHTCNDFTMDCLETLWVHVNISKFWFTVRFGKEMTSFTIFSIER